MTFSKFDNSRKFYSRSGVFFYNIGMTRDELPDGADVNRPTNDVLFDVLSDEYRRYFLYLLLDNDAVTGDELREAMTDWVAFSGAGTTADRLAVRFYHVDVPIMLQARLVRHDPATDSFALEAVSADVRAILRRSRDREVLFDADPGPRSNGDPE